ncbi:MAG: O-antigen polymerase [Patescibacteria group bacterium]
MVLFFVFIILGMAVGLSYFFGNNKFSPAKLLLSLWLLAIGVAQLRLSPYEAAWSGKFWLILALFFLLFYLSYVIFSRLANRKIKAGQIIETTNSKIFLITILILTILSLAANAYIFSRFGTLPILSSVPDKMRFIINKQVFGLWEYAALLPRIIIPLAFIFLLSGRRSRVVKIIIFINILLGFLLLSLYASRLVIILPILMSYFGYLIIKIKKINWRKIAVASMVVLILVLVISVAIPMFRHFITYRDYYADVDYNAFTYLADLSKLNLPAQLDFLIPLYLIPAFNLQAFFRATDYFSYANWHWGGYGLSTFNSFLKIFGAPELNGAIAWKEMFLPWWVTATFLFNYWVDFGWLGIIVAAIFWGVLLAVIYNWVTKKPTVLSVMLFAYFSFVTVMSIYTNYLMREEFYLDIILILLVGLPISHKLTKRA